MASRTASLARFKSLLEVDPDSLEGVLPRTRTEAEEPAGASLAPADWERLIQILKHGLARLTDVALQLLAIEHVGEMYEYQLGDAERALRWWAQVLAAHNFHSRAAEELERLSRASGDWRRLVQVYTNSMSRLEPLAKRDIVLRLARVHFEELGEANRAERLLQGLWDKEQDRDALDALQALYVRTGKKDQLASLLRQRIAMQDTVPDRVELLLQLGFIQDIELGASDLALESYREVLKLDTFNRQATEALEQIYLRQERWQELLGIYEGLAAAANTPEQAAHYLVRMARICDDAAVGERTRSRHLWQRLRDLCPTNMALLEEMERRFEPMERWEELAEVLGLQAALAEPGPRARLFERQGRLYGDRLHDLRRAIACWQKVLQLEPENVVALLALSDLCTQAESWEELISVLQRLIAIGERDGRDATFMASLHASLAGLEERVLNQPAQAIERWRHVLALDPAQVQAMAELERLLAIEVRWAECVEILDRKLAIAASPGEQVEILLRQAVLFRDGVGDADASSRAFRRVLALNPTDETAHRGICDIYREHGQWQPLVEQLFGWLGSMKDSRGVVQLLQEAAVVFEDQLGQHQEAFTVWQSALKQDPSNEVTTSNLERLAAALGRWDELLQVYDSVVKATPSARIKLGLLVAMGRCYGLELGQLEPAVSLLHEALHLDPEFIPALEVLEECYRRTCRWQELLVVVRRHAELERDTERLVPLLCSLGELQCRLGAADHALITYRKVLEIAPAQREALLALESLYLAFGLWAELVEALKRELELGVPDDRRLGVLLQLGELYEQKLGDSASATSAYREALAIEPGQVEAMQALERLYDQAGESEAYLDIVERQMELSQDVEHKVAMLERIAGAWEEQFGKRDRAMACLEKLLVLDPKRTSAHVNVERLCHEAGDLRQLAHVLRRHADAAEGSERIELLLELGALLGDTLRELVPAAEVYREVLAGQPSDPRALLALAGIQEKLGAWQEAQPVLEQLAGVLEGSERSAVLLRLGHIHEVELKQVEAAEQCYNQALAVDETCGEVMLRLAEIYRARADWEAAAAMMVRAEPHTANSAKKAQLLFDAGMIRLEQLSDEAAATELLARTLQVDPDHMRAGLPLSNLYEKQGRMAELEPVLDMLARKVEPRADRALAHQIYFRLGTTAAALGKVEKAIRFFLDARSIDVSHLPTLRALADLQYQSGVWQEAFKTLQTLLVNHRDALDPAEVANIFFRLGSIKEQQGEQRKALSYHEKALEQLTTHGASLEATARIQEALGNWDAVVRAKVKLLAVVFEDDRPKLLQECAEIHLQKLNAVPPAIEAYQAAVALRPEDRSLLNRLLDILTESRRWPEALQVVMRLSELETGQVKAWLLHTGAVICRDELGAPDQALELFEAALDSAPDLLKAFESIDRLCTERKDWHALAHSYRRMIGRQGEDGPVPLRAMLWHNLGEVYRTRLKQVTEATANFEIASRLEPDNLQRHEILAELYQLAGPAQAQKAIAEHRMLIARDPKRVASLSALAALYGGLGQRDAQACICTALALLGQASAEEQQLEAHYRIANPARARARITEELWNRCICHGLQDPKIDELLAAVAHLLVERLSRPAKEFGLKRKHRARPEEPCYDLFHQITGVLGAPAAELYAMPEQSVALMLANTAGGPSVVLGAPFRAPMGRAELGFTLGQQLTYLRGGYFLCRLFPSPSQLRLVLLAMLKLVAPELPLEPAEAAEVSRLLEQLAPGMDWQAAQGQLAPRAHPFVESGGRFDLGTWWNGITHTANRVGLIFSGDLHVAARILQLEPSPFGSMPASERIRELVSYAISEEYFAVRRELGLATS